MSQVQTIDRLLLILTCFSDQEPQLSMTDISKRTGLTTSTTHRLMASMEHHGMLSRSPNGREYMLGYRFAHWASIVENSNMLQKQARPLLEALSIETGETAVLMVRDQQWAVCVERVDSSQLLRLAMNVGQRIPLHAGSSAKILLAFLKPEEIQHYIETQGLSPVAINTITDPERLVENLANIREKKYAVSFQERDLGAVGLTLPIYNAMHQVIAGIGIVGPVGRLTLETIEVHLPLVRKSAEKLSRLQGWI